MTDNTYISLNSELNLFDTNRNIQFDKDTAAVRAYFLEHVNQNTVFFHSLEEKLEYLVEHGYYEAEFLAKYDPAFIKRLFKHVYGTRFRFRTFVGAYKFYRQYALKTFDGKRYLERYEDRVVTNALYLADGDEKFATRIADEILSGRLQPATPTFLNSGKKQRGDLVSCYLSEVEDSMASIGRAVNTALQLSKRGGGVAFNLTNLRASGDPIKKIENQASGVIPVMKIIENAVKYSNQLGQRDGSAAVYLNIFHRDIETFLDSRRENADEAIRINKLSLGIVIPDVFFELVKNDEDMYTFSPYDVSTKYGMDFADVNMTDVYRELVNDPNVTKSKIRARTMLARIAETQVESGYPYIMFEDNVNNQSPIAGKVKFSNLCSEILQVSEPSIVGEDGNYEKVGKDISCNLASLNVAKVMAAPDVFGKTVETGIRVLSRVSDISEVINAPAINRGNRISHAVGLGVMNLHGFLAANKIEYGSAEALEFVDVFFATLNFHSIQASAKIARERGETFVGFEDSKYASGEYFETYIDAPPVPKSAKVKRLFKDAVLPDADAWRRLRGYVAKHGMYNQYRLAVAPTGSISYINDATASMLPVTAKVETRKEGTMGQVYWPAPGMTNENHEFYKDGYEIGWKPIIDTYAAAQKHVDQGMSLTLFFNQDATTREINKAQMYAWRKGIKTLYYVRIKMNVMDGLDNDECVSCSV